MSRRPRSDRTGFRQMGTGQPPAKAGLGQRVFRSSISWREQMRIGTGSGSRIVSILSCLLLAAVSLTAVRAEAQTPAPGEVVRRACEAAGGIDLFQRAGALGVEVQIEEVSEDGNVSRSTIRRYVNAPGPIPGRIEMPAQHVVAGDDGVGGWALIRGRPDQRMQTTLMVRRMIQTDLFPAMLPFSLTWSGVTVREVASADHGGRAVWRLLLEFDSGFFSTPQISRFWVLDLDKKDFSLVAAESPAIDLGQGIETIGMFYSWESFAEVRGLRLPTRIRVVGLAPDGSQKSHTKVDSLRWFPVPIGEAALKFENPIPHDQRPRIPGAGAPPQPPR